MSFILVKELGKEREYGLDLKLVAGKKGLQKKIADSRIHKLGLALAGFTDHVQPHQIHILGNTELSYLKALPPGKREEIIRKICSLEISCFVVTATQSIPKSLIRESEKASIPLFKTGLMSHFFIERATKFLEQRLSTATGVHGVLVDVFGVGVLILGRSGIGKSECALDLIERGHRFVADDLITIIRRGDILIGAGAEKSPRLKHHIEIRGVGIVDIFRIFGVKSVRLRKRIEVIIELVMWDKMQGDYERIGLKKKKKEMLGVKISHIVIPLSPGKNISVIAEVIAMNYLLDLRGVRPAEEYNQELRRILSEHEMPSVHFDEEDTE